MDPKRWPGISRSLNSKRTLAIGYLVATGLSLSVVLLLRLAGDGPTSAVGTVSGVALAAALVYAGYWLDGSDLADERVWSVAVWGGFGLGVVTLAVVAVVFLYWLTPFESRYPGMLVSNLAAGGVVGVLVGAVRELEHENETVKRLNERNAVLNRVLRHNIRNDMNVVLGHADLLEDELEPPHDAHLRTIRRKADRIATLGTKARRLEQTLAEDGVGAPVDAVSLTEERVGWLRERYPGADVSADLPDAELYCGDDRLGDLLDNVLSNAVEHNDDDPEVSVEVGAVDRDGEEWVEFRVADDGPGIPDPEVTALSDGGEAPLRHGSGLGLWMVKWFVERYDGELEIAENDPRGSVVRIRIPAA